jgi:hypothetical protein
MATCVKIAADWPADEEDVIYALNAKDTARSLGLQQGAAKVSNPQDP